MISVLAKNMHKKISYHIFLNWVENLVAKRGFQRISLCTCVQTKHDVHISAAYLIHIIECE